MIARAASSGTFASYLFQLQDTLSQAAGNKQTQSDFLTQKQQDTQTTSDALSQASQTLSDVNDQVESAGESVLNITPFVYCDITTGTPTATAQGKDEVLQSLNQASMGMNQLAGNFSNTQLTFGSGSDQMNGLPSSVSQTATQIKQCISLIELAKGTLPSGDSRIGNLNDAEKLLSTVDQGSANETASVTPLPGGFSKTQTYITQASGNATNASASYTSAITDAGLITCQGNCGPANFDGSFPPEGEGVIIGADTTSYAISLAQSQTAAVGQNLTQASQALSDFQKQLSTASPLVSSANANVQKANGIVSQIGAQ